MSRSRRLLDLLQSLRRHRRPVAGGVLAEELGVPLRTLCRDIATLKAQCARIDGEAGVGDVLHSGFMLPPLMFSDEDIEALVLGSRRVSDRADGALGAAARNALAEIVAVLCVEDANSSGRFYVELLGRPISGQSPAFAAPMWHDGGMPGSLSRRAIEHKAAGAPGWGEIAIARADAAAVHAT